MAKDIKDIISKHESVLSGLKEQAARALTISKNKETSIKSEVKGIEHLGSMLNVKILEFLEWNTSTIHVQNLRIKEHVEYRNDLVDFMIEKTIADDKMKELEDELIIKEEDLSKMEEENNNLKGELEDKNKEVEVLKNLVKNKEKIPEKGKEKEDGKKTKV